MEDFLGGKAGAGAGAGQVRERNESKLWLRTLHPGRAAATQGVREPRGKQAGRKNRASSDPLEMYCSTASLISHRLMIRCCMCLLSSEQHHTF